MSGRLPERGPAPGEGISVEGRGVVYTFPGAPSPALRGVDLDARPGTFTALLGPNGSGKSTLLAAAGGLLAPEAGAVRLDGPGVGAGRAPASLSRARLARAAAFLPARPEVPADYSSLEVVLMGRHPFGRGVLLEEPADVARAERALERTGGAPFADRPCAALSGGERQRVLLARVLCQDAPLVLLDEPTSAQDLAHVLDLFALFAELAREGRTVVAATHAINAAARFADHLVVLAEGRVVAGGAPAEVLRADVLREVFAVDAVLGADGDVPYAVPRSRAAP